MIGRSETGSGQARKSGVSPDVPKIRANDRRRFCKAVAQALQTERPILYVTAPQQVTPGTGRGSRPSVIAARPGSPPGTTAPYRGLGALKNTWRLEHKHAKGRWRRRAF